MRFLYILLAGSQAAAQVTTTDLEPTTTTSESLSSTPTESLSSSPTEPLSSDLSTTSSLDSAETSLTGTSSSASAIKSTSASSDISITVTLSSSSTGGPSSTSSAPESTDTDFSVATDIGDGVAEDITPPPDVPTPEQHRAEEQANLPLDVPSNDELRSIAVLETGLFDHFVRTAPVPGDEEVLSIPDTVASCELKRKRAFSNLIAPYGIDVIKARSLVGGATPGCIWVEELTIPIRFHFIRAAYKVAAPYEAGKTMLRFNAQLDYLNRVYAPLNLQFELQGYTIWNPPPTGPNSHWTEVTKSEGRLVTWQKKTNPNPKKTELTVWVVNNFTGGWLNGVRAFLLWL